MAHPLIGKYQKTAFDKLSAEQRLEARQEIKDALASKAGAKISQEDRVILMQRWIATFDDPPPVEVKPENEGKKPQFSFKLPRLKLPAIKRSADTKPMPAPNPKQSAQKPTPIEPTQRPASVPLQRPISISPLRYAKSALLGAIIISLLLATVLIARHAMDTFALPRNSEDVISVLSTGSDLILGSGTNLPKQILSVLAIALLIALPLVPATMIAGSITQRMRANEAQLIEMIHEALALGRDPAFLLEFAHTARIPKSHFEVFVAQAKREALARACVNFSLPADLLTTRGNVAAAHFHVLFEQLSRISKLPNSSEIGTHILGRTDGTHAEKAVWLVLQKQISS
jgi:hypothetical protein